VRRRIDATGFVPFAGFARRDAGSRTHADPDPLSHPDYDADS